MNDDNEAFVYGGEAAARIRNMQKRYGYTKDEIGILAANLVEKALELRRVTGNEDMMLVDGDRKKVFEITIPAPGFNAANETSFGKRIDKERNSGNSLEKQ